MAGTLVANTINTDTGLFSTNNAYSGIAKAWVQFSATSGTITVNKSFNISSVTRNSSGTYVANFATTMTDTGYVPVGSSGGTASTYNSGALAMFQTASTGVSTAPTTSSFLFSTLNSGGSSFDPAYINIAVFGN